MDNFIKFKRKTTWIIRALIAGGGGLCCTIKGLYIELAYQTAAGLFWVGISLLLYALCIICAILAYRVKARKETE